MPGRFQTGRQVPVVVPSHDPVIVPSPAPAVAPAPVTVRPNVSPQRAPGMNGSQAAPMVAPDAEEKPQKKQNIELDQVPFDEQTFDGPMMQERGNVPGKMKVLEVPRNTSGPEPSFQELPIEEPADSAEPVPVESVKPEDTLDFAEPAEPAEPAAPAEPAGPAMLDDPIEPAEPANSVKPKSQEMELPGAEEALPDALPEALPDTLPEALPEPTLLEIPGGLEDSQSSPDASEQTNTPQIMRAIQKRQPLKRILSFNEAKAEGKTGFPTQSDKNSTENQTSRVPQNENALKSISFNAIRKATGMEEHLVAEVQSANWEVVEKKDAIVQLTAAEEPIASDSGPQTVLEIPAELPVNVEMEKFPERPSNAQPADEYIIDSNALARKKDVKETQKGMASGVEIQGNWEADIQNETGTFIFYDGIQGRSTIQSPNPVYIYAPRFRAVRQVLDLNVDEQVTMTGDLYTPTQVSTANRTMETSTTRQNQQAGTGTTRTVMLEAQANAGTGILDGNVAVQMKTQEAVIAQENRMINGPGALNGKTRAITADGLIEIKAWTQTENMRVFIDQQSASASTQTLAAPSLYTVEEGDKKQDVKIYKVASSNSAKPGETVDFIIYFENTGNTPIGNITLVDNLPARLEIVEDSAESSVDSNFTYEINGNGSQTLRWEVTQPLHVGEKGAVKFKALVR